MKPAHLLRLACALLVCLVFSSVVWSFTTWSETRGVYDDICYLRQAHLFQRFGIDGLDTDIARDDDQFFYLKLRAIGVPKESDIRTALCHRYMETTKKYVMQYPPGPGLLLAAFHPGRQVASLYITSGVIILLVLMWSILKARTISNLAASTVFGCAVLYLMVNPGKSSYSLPPTMAICAVSGWLTVLTFEARRQSHRLLATFMLALLLGLSFNLRLGNMLLGAGYFIVLGFMAVRNFDFPSWSRMTVFGGAFALGLVPTLVANAINVGHAFSTPYGGMDTAPRNFGWNQISESALLYFKGTQGVLLSSAIIFSILFWFAGRRLAISNHGPIAFLLVANLAANLVFFFTHPVYTTYYTVPISLLTLWTVHFAFLHGGVAPVRNYLREKVF